MYYFPSCFCFISHRSDFICINDTVSKQHKTEIGIVVITERENQQMFINNVLMSEK